MSTLMYPRERVWTEGNKIELGYVFSYLENPRPLVM
jgi:hypothetical protein